MWKSKRRDDDLTRRFDKNRKVRETEFFVSGHWDPNQDVWTGLCDGLKYFSSKSVASITLRNGDETLFSCLGIVIERNGCLTRFLTSAKLAITCKDFKNKLHDGLKIEVCLEGTKVHNGFLALSAVEYDFAVIEVYAYLDVHVVLEHALDILPHGEEVLAVGRGSSGQLMARTVNFSGDLRASEGDGDLDCIVQQAWEGGPLFSFNGNFVGMSLNPTTRRALILSWGTISKHLQHCVSLPLPKKTSLALSNSSTMYSFGAGPIGEKSISHAEVHRELLNQEQLDLDSMGYPKLPLAMLSTGMVLVNTFEETFGDIFDEGNAKVLRLPTTSYTGVPQQTPCDEGVWSKLSKKASNMDRTVVALASFTGEKRFFACTGFFIEWNGAMTVLTSASLVRDSVYGNNVLDGLRIEVSLPKKQHREGILQHYNLHYNIALVCVRDHRAVRAANTVVDWTSCEVAAVGRGFESGALMATIGKIVPWTGTLDCDFLVRSSCKISKAGIGGPLVTPDGDVIGMNFFDRKIGTPFLYWRDICDILALFEKKSEPPGVSSLRIAGDRKVTLNKWPVPKPCWRHPDCFDEGEFDDDEDFLPKHDKPARLSYARGMKVYLF